VSTWRAWGRVHPLALDAALGVVLLAFSLISMPAQVQADNRLHDPNAWAWLLAALATLTLAVRQRYPEAVAASTYTAVVASTIARLPNGASVLGLLVATYSLATHGPPKRSLRVFAALASVAAVVLFIALPFGLLSWADLVVNVLCAVAAYAVGDNVRRRRLRVMELAERAERLEHERFLEANQAVAAERARIARELHDVVAHSLSVMVVQAGAARRLLAQDAERAAAALATVEDTGRGALVEMRRLLGLLREGAEAERAPQPGMAGLADLIAADPNLSVHLRVEGTPVELPPGIELSAFRIVQEALTNVRKHAGPADTEVVLRYGAFAVEIEVADDGRGASTLVGAHGPESANAPGAGGVGLVGMRERVALCGGHLQAGPRPGGGWLVRASLPLEGAPA
jgi:signal transduction histidine kinase